MIVGRIISARDRQRGDTSDLPVRSAHRLVAASGKRDELVAKPRVRKIQRHPARPPRRASRQTQLTLST
jgi:hypothetical protein